MRIEETSLKGCFIIEPKVLNDERGSFMETFHQEKFEKAIGYKVDFIQDNQSISKKGVVRALHMQKVPFAQAKLVRVIKGRVLDVAVDARKDSQTFGKHFSIELSENLDLKHKLPRYQGGLCLYKRVFKVKVSITGSTGPETIQFLKKNV